MITWSMFLHVPYCHCVEKEALPYSYGWLCGEFEVLSWLPVRQNIYNRNLLLTKDMYDLHFSASFLLAQVRTCYKVNHRHSCCLIESALSAVPMGTTSLFEAYCPSITAKAQIVEGSLLSNCRPWRCTGGVRVCGSYCASLCGRQQSYTVPSCLRLLGMGPIQKLLSSFLLSML